MISRDCLFTEKFSEWHLLFYSSPVIGQHGWLNRYFCACVVRLWSDDLQKTVLLMMHLFPSATCFLSLLTMSHRLLFWKSEHIFVLELILVQIHAMIWCFRLIFTRQYTHQLTFKYLIKKMNIYDNSAGTFIGRVRCYFTVHA